MKKNLLNRCLRKLILSGVILLGGLLTTYQYGLAAGSSGILETKVSIYCGPCELKEVLQQLEEQLNSRFVYSEIDIRDIQLDRISQTQVSTGQILDIILKPNNLTYKVMNGRIVIKRNIPPKTGGLKGKVYDADSHSDMLVGATVRIEGTGLGTTVSVDGTFEFKEVPVGVYTVAVSFVGYQTRRLEEIKILQDNISVIEVALDQSSTELGEVVVRGDIPVQFAPIQNSTEISLMSEIQRSNVVITGISSQQITRSLDRDAADVVRRVPGVSLLNNFVLIRGMSQRYTMTYINGMLAPSTEEDQRAFSFDLLPSGLLDNIMIYKSPSPELPGGFAGGVVKVSTKAPGAVRRIQIGFSGQYRDGTSFTDGYSNSAATSKDWMGTGLEDRMYEDKLYDTGYKFPHDGNKIFAPEAMRQVTRDFPEPYDLKPDHIGMDQRARLNYYDSWKIGSTRLNNLTSLGYTNQTQFRRSKVVGEITPFFNEEQALAQLPSFESIDSVYNQRVRLSALQNLTWQVNDLHSVQAVVLLNRSVDDQTGIRDKAIDQGTTNRLLEREVNYEYSVQDLYSGQLSGQHRLGAHEVVWRAGTSYSAMTSPDIQTYVFNFVDSAKTQGQFYVRNSDGTTRRGSFLTDEKGINLGLDYSVTLAHDLKLKAGGMYQKQDRTFESWYYDYRYADSSQDNTYQYAGSTPWNQLSGIVNDSLILDESGQGLYLQRDFAEGIFFVHNRYQAAYAGAEVPLMNKKFQLNAGLRYEWNDRVLSDPLDREIFTSGGYDWSTGEPLGDTIPDTQQVHWLSSASINWNITHHMKLTTTYGKTIDRPAYREASPFSYYDFESFSRVTGNAGLKDAEIQNYDLRWEYYPSEGEFIAIGVFYKDMKNIIEQVIRNISPETGIIYTSYANAPEATVKGVELEARKNLGFIPWRPMQYFSIIANAAYMQNRLDLRPVYEELGVKPEGKPYRPFMGAAPYVVNASLYFAQPEWGTTLSVLVNSIGQRMVASGRLNVAPVYETSRTTLDLVWIQQITSFLQMKVGVQDILNQAITQYRDTNLDEKYDEGKLQEFIYRENEQEYTKYGYDYATRSYRPGSYYSLGFQFEF
ncbi:carboxypeptidase-like regulatory domain-containing protein [Reichenbachiella agarivorans]|uniref:Carboxypeptidase-like regulatory domain-containing protein n=1 Tax=Reichenbachiella agarivorans TaxID=2979464 RepID=A0ABY6CN69_9BACT|nr:TonB-dependent receptor [Reichenbachiella agarivorans]UXP31956.1 carboxypeptidase-like regulatory domain-containing protein [Reichenbachiella agarivorans]